MTSYKARMETALEAGFAPLQLVVRDDSAKHEGHAGARPEGETHFHVFLVSQEFEGQSRITRSRAVHKALAKELEEHVHALALELKAPSEV